MAATEDAHKDRFGSLMTIVTVAVAIWSLYYSGVQAEIARKNLEITCNEAHASLQNAVADMEKKLAAGVADRNLADLLGRLADLQAKLADQQKQTASHRTDTALAELEQKLGDVQQSLMNLKKDQEKKETEIASLRAQLAEASRPAATPSVNLGLPSTKMLAQLNDFPFPTHKFVAPNFMAALTKPPPDESWSGHAQALLMDFWAVFRKYPAPMVYFGIMVLMALGRLFSSK